MNILAVILPFLYFLVRGRFAEAIVSLMLQATIVGWIPAAIWAIRSVRVDKWEKRKQKIMWEVQHSPMNLYTS